MTQASLFNPLQRSRLMNILSGKDVVSAESETAHFGERLGKLIEFSNSFSLADAHYYIGKMTRPESTEDGSEVHQRAEEIVNEFLRVRALLMQTIIKSFHPEKRTRFKLPVPNLPEQAETALDFEPYRRFHAIQQREMESQIQPLRKFVRETMSDLSLPLKKLASLDEAMGDTLHVFASKQLMQLPKALESHFNQLQNTHLKDESPISDWLSRDGWLSIFYRDLQSILLAELDFRLLPVTGMIESLYKEVNKTHD